MSTDPVERLEALRREVLAEQPAVTPVGAPVPPAPTTPVPAPAPAPASPAPPAPAPAPAPPGPPVPPEPPQTGPSAVSGPPREGPPGGDRSDVAASPDDASPGALSRLVSDIGDLDLRGLVADRSLASWLGIGLLVVGGYLVLSWVVPGVSLIGSLALLLAGVVLLYLHLVRGAPPWALYAGAALAGMGAMRILGALLPGDWHGTSAIGVGVAFLAIGFLRHSQAGGYGWQGLVGVAAIVVGLVQMVLGWLPGSPGLSDLLSPAVLLVLGALLVLGTRWRRDPGRPPVDGA